MVKKLLSKLFGGDKSPKNTATTTSISIAPSPDGEANLEGFVQYVVQSLVMHPNDVKVSSEVDEQGLLIRIRCRQEEVGRVIGKSGKTIRAIRSLVKGAAARSNQKASVIVMED